MAAIEMILWFSFNGKVIDVTPVPEVEYYRKIFQQCATGHDGKVDSPYLLTVKCLQASKYIVNKLQFK